MRKQISFLLLGCLFLPLLAACGMEGSNSLLVDSITELVGAAASESSDGSFEMEEIPAKPVPGNSPEVLTVNWNMGYIGSVNSQHPNQLYTAPDVYYSYTDVITVPKAGTKIYFADDGGKYASGSVYVVSFWRQAEDGWELDPDARHYTGSGSAPSDVLRMQNGRMNYIYITSRDQEHLRFCYRSEQTTGFTPEFPKVYVISTEEEPTSAAWNNVMQWIEEHKKEMNHTALNGLTVNLLGDSYFAGNGLDPDYVWPALMAKKYGMVLHNGGVNGSTISNYVSTNHPMCIRFRDLPDNNPDIVLVEGGKNDYNKNVPIGVPDSTDTGTFLGALNVILTGLRQKYPGTVIICITNWKFEGTNAIGLGYSDYAEAMKTAADRQGVFCFDASDPEISGVDMTNADFRAAYCMKRTDVSHLNLEGMKLVLPYFESYLNKCYSCSVEVERRM